MKKVLFFQAKGNSCGGVWFVNETIANSLVNNGYDVNLIAIRNNPGPITINMNQPFFMHTINEKDIWEIVRFTDIKDNLKKFKIFKSIKLIIKKIIDEVKLSNDFYKAKKYINNYNPDYIICSQYQLLDAIPKKYLSKTIVEHHTSFKNTIESTPKVIEMFNKYKNKIAKFVWLTKNTCDDAIKYGYDNSTYIYNPIRFISEKKADIINNKKLVTISRLNAPEKQIYLMLEIADEVLKNHSDWTLELYGSDLLDDKSMNVINNNSQIKLMGNTNKVKEKLLSSSIYLSTSSFEGFPLSITEAYECGVPCVVYNYGESCTEQIIDNKTGYIVNFGNKKEFIKKLSKLMDDTNLLLEVSNSCKEFAKKFNIDEVTKNWILLFNEIEKGSRDKNEN